MKKYVNNLILRTLLVGAEFSIIEIYGGMETKAYIPKVMLFVDKAYLLENNMIVLEGYMDETRGIPIYMTLEEQEKALSNYSDSSKVKYLKAKLESIKNKLQG